MTRTAILTLALLVAGSAYGEGHAPCERYDRAKLTAAREACFIDERTHDAETMQICTRINEAITAYYDCKAKRAASDALEPIK